LAGVDLIMADISKSWLDIGAAICEVNAQPQIGDGTTPQVYVDLLSGMVARDGRIPIVLIIDSRPQTGADALGRELQSRFERHGLPCVLASSAGVWMAEPQVVCQPRDFFKSALAAIALPTAGAAVLVASISELRRHGLPFDRCEAVVLAHGGSANGPDEAGLDPLLRLLLPHIGHGLVIDAGNTVALALAMRLAPQRLNVIQAALSDVVATAARAWQAAMPINPLAPVSAPAPAPAPGSTSADAAPP
jgi:cyanophycin synthetase